MAGKINTTMIAQIIRNLKGCFKNYFKKCFKNCLKGYLKDYLEGYSKYYLLLLKGKGNVFIYYCWLISLEMVVFKYLCTKRLQNFGDLYNRTIPKKTPHLHYIFKNSLVSSSKNKTLIAFKLVCCCVVPSRRPWIEVSNVNVEM